MITVKNLTKKYGNNIAVSNLSFNVEKGKIYGFLGPNGAGKSTTMNIITGCLSATDGEVLIGGHDIFEEPMKAKRLIGYLPEHPPLYMDMTPNEYLNFVAQAKGLSAKEAKEQIEYVVEVTGIESMMNRIILNLSKGYKQRVGVAQALLGNPEIIILDEPSVGLDPKQIIEMRELIKGLKKNHTVILSSHILSEIKAVCDHIMIISHGKLVASDTPDNLEKMLIGTTTVDMLVSGERENIKRALSTVKHIRKATITRLENGLVKVSVTSKEDVDVREDLFYAFADAKCPILEMNNEKASLEEIFLQFTQNDIKTPNEKEDK